MQLPVKTVVVPIDFSKTSFEALETARSLVENPSGLHTIYVLEHLSALHPGMVWETMDDAERLECAEQALEKALSDRGLSGGGVHTTTTVGNPALEVARFAETIGADLLVVASHGRTGLARVALGSVAERVVRYATCPVLVVKGPAA